MRRYVRSSANKARRTNAVKITAAHNTSERIFTPDNLTQILSQLPQMNDDNVGFDVTPDENLLLLIGDDTYEIVWD